jgi:hypothetical protein
MNLTSEEAVFYISKPLSRIPQVLYVSLFQELPDFLFLFRRSPFFATQII